MNEIYLSRQSLARVTPVPTITVTGIDLDIRVDGEIGA